ncbi:hypothetical protein [Streptomyces zaomyceticus]|uniref:hypothetical protein n=1 Tax=Streptomyces zaomyceticus TaxID=68286 RepID=UPI003791E08E
MAKATAYDAHIATWHWFSRDHALTATLLSRRCQDLEANPAAPSEEEEARGLTWSESQAAEHRAYSFAAIVAAASFLEAALNELLESAEHENVEVGGGRGRLASTERVALVTLRSKWGDRGPAPVGKAKEILALFGKSAFDEDSAPYKPAQTLGRLRNRLVHYRPAWRVAGVGRGDDWFATELEPLNLEQNPFTAPNNVYFPDRALGYGLTSWAWDAAFGFAEAFFARIGVDPGYAELRPQLT